MVPTIAEQLCDHIDLIRRQHRAEITPSFGQVETLFDLADALRDQGFGPAVRVVATGPRCRVDGCTSPYEGVRTIAGSPYCAVHAALTEGALTSLEVLMPELYSQLARVNWPTRSGQ